MPEVRQGQKVLRQHPSGFCWGRSECTHPNFLKGVKAQRSPSFIPKNRDMFLESNGINNDAKAAYFTNLRASGINISKIVITKL